jgi:hypothetical protein
MLVNIVKAKNCEISLEISVFSGSHTRRPSDEEIFMNLQPDLRPHKRCAEENQHFGKTSANFLQQEWKLT